MPVAFVRWALALYLIFIFASVAFLPGVFLRPPYARPAGLLDFFRLSALPIRILGFSGCFFALLFALNRFPRVLPWLLWFWLVLVIGQVPRIREVQFDYIGYLLIFFGLAPKEWNAEWRRIGLIVLGASNTYTGLFKLTNENWRAPDHGHLFEIVLRFPNQKWMVDSQLLSVAIWLQLLALPGVLWRRTALATWVSITGIQLWILFALQMEHISIGVLILHFAFLDISWRKNSIHHSRVYEKAIS